MMEQRAVMVDSPKLDKWNCYLDQYILINIPSIPLWTYLAEIIRCWNNLYIYKKKPYVTRRIFFAKYHLLSTIENVLKVFSRSLRTASTRCGRSTWRTRTAPFCSATSARSSRGCITSVRSWAWCRSCTSCTMTCWTGCTDTRTSYGRTSTSTRSPTSS